MVVTKCLMLKPVICTKSKISVKPKSTAGEHFSDKAFI